MKHSVETRNGWTTTTKGDRALNYNRNLQHGANTLIGNVPRIIAMGKSRFTHSACGNCVHFSDCQRLKNVKAETNYCQFNENRFERKS